MGKKKKATSKVKIASKPIIPVKKVACSEGKRREMQANAVKDSNKRQICEDNTKKARKRAKTEEYTINTRVSLPAIKETVMKLTKDQKEAVKGMGFGGLLELNCHQLDRELCGWLVRNFDPNDYSLNVHGRKLTITTIDVENIMGLRSEGSLVNAEGSNEDEDISELCNKYGFVNGRLKVSQLREDLASSVDAGEEFRVRFALLALSCMCCPNTKDGIKASLMHILKDPSSLATINWARFLLDKLGIAVKNYKKKNIAGGYVGGCVFFLMIFYFEHFVPVGAPMATLDTQSSPRLRFWKNAEIKDRCRFIYAGGLLSKEKVELVGVMAPTQKVNEVEDISQPQTTTSPSRSEEEHRFNLIENELKDVKVQLLKMSNSFRSEFNGFKEEMKELMPVLVREAMAEILVMIPELVRGAVSEKLFGKVAQKDKTRPELQSEAKGGIDIDLNVGSPKSPLRANVGSEKSMSEKVSPVVELQTVDAENPIFDSHVREKVVMENFPSPPPQTMDEKTKDAGVPLKRDDDVDYLITPFVVMRTMSENGSSPHGKVTMAPDEDSPNTVTQLKSPLNVGSLGDPIEVASDKCGLSVAIEVRSEVQRDDPASSPHDEHSICQQMTDLKTPLNVGCLGDPIEVASDNPIEVAYDKHFPIELRSEVHRDEPASSPHEEQSVCQQMTTRDPSKRAPSKYCKSPYFNFEKVASKKQPLTSADVDSLPLRTAQKLLKEHAVLKLTIMNFTPFEKKLIKFVFDTKLPASEVLVRSHINYADRGNLQCLEEGKWVNDMVINCIVGKLTYRAKKKRQQERWFLPTFVAQRAIHGTTDVRTTGSHFFGQNRYTGDVKCVKKIFCPINQLDTHWFCCMVDIAEKKINIYDSLISPSSNHSRTEMVKKLVDHLDGVMSYFYGNAYDMAIKEFTIQRCMWVPQQTNADDCGVYTINFMYVDTFCPGVEFLFKPSEARSKILVDIVHTKYNSARDQVIAAVDAYNVHD